MTATPAAAPALRVRSENPVRSGSASPAPTGVPGRCQVRNPKARPDGTSSSSAPARDATLRNPPRTSRSPLWAGGRNPRGATPGSPVWAGRGNPPGATRGKSVWAGRGNPAGATPWRPLSAASRDAQPRASRIGFSRQALALTRRGRTALVGFFILAAVLIAFAVASGASATGTGVPVGVYEKSLSQVVVRPGDSLWSIAARAEPDADPRLVIQQITEINALPSPEIVVGQRLWVPKG